MEYLLNYYREEAIFDNVAWTGCGPQVIFGVFEEMAKIGLSMSIEIPQRLMTQFKEEADSVFSSTTFKRKDFANMLASHERDSESLTDDNRPTFQRHDTIELNFDSNINKLDKL